MIELTLNEIQQENLKIIKAVHKICSKEKITYTLFYGSLLGAIRHNGFIPWDDDLDIAMPRADFEKLSLYFKNHENELLPYKWFSKETVADYPYMIPRICNTDFKMVIENTNSCEMGTFIDVYPMDGAGNGRDILLYNRAWFYSSMYFSKSLLYYVETKGFVKNLVKKIVFCFSRIIKRESIQKKLIHIAQKYPYEESDFIASMIWLVYGRRNVFRKTDFEELVLHEFEDTQLCIPANYDRMLKDYYGEYMRLPPENERVGHHFYRMYKK